MQSAKYRLTWGLLALLFLSGCQTWQSKAGLPDLGFNSGERKILKQAQNDPFPSPAEVGMK